MSESTYKKGLIVEKGEALKSAKVNIKSHWESLTYLYVDNKLKPENHKLNDLRVLASNLFQEIELYQDLHAEIEELKNS